MGSGDDGVERNSSDETSASVYPPTRRLAMRQGRCQPGWMGVKSTTFDGIARIVGWQITANDATDPDDASQPIVRYDHVALPDLPAESPDIDRATTAFPFLCLDECPLYRLLVLEAAVVSLGFRSCAARNSRGTEFYDAFVIDCAKCSISPSSTSSRSAHTVSSMHPELSSTRTGVSSSPKQKMPTHTSPCTVRTIQTQVRHASILVDWKKPLAFEQRILPSQASYMYPDPSSSNSMISMTAFADTFFLNTFPSPVPFLFAVPRDA